MFEIRAYQVGERVTINGLYVCIPCGYRQHFLAGDTFPPCLNCMSRVSRPVSDLEFAEAAARGEEIDEFDQGAVVPNMELWELLRKDHDQSDLDHREQKTNHATFSIVYQ